MTREKKLVSTAALRDGDDAWSDSPDYEQPFRTSHAVGAAVLVIILLLLGWSWASADHHTLSTYAGHPVAHAQ